MSTVLTGDQRKQLDTTVQKAREISELAARDALTSLAVAETHRPAYLDDAQNQLRLALRAKARQLGDDVAMRSADLALLIRDVAYEQWHRLLFARFLERNDLLRHADFPDTPVTISDCEELAAGGEVDEPDGWSVAASFAARLLPGVFRLDDPAFQVRYATEHRLALEDLLMSIPESVFEAEDALGWVYQFWQTAEKKRVNEAGNKIGGADLSPVTQLFTENYMVRFLLENSLGAWWAARHPDSPLVEEWKYLRRLDDGTPAAGTFEEWPATAAEVTVMDPCCGSGHFLVAMFGMLWRMRAEEDYLSPVEAQDAVLRENLFGLELDPRCTQIATFNVALEAWKQGGYREIPIPHIACSGVPVRQSLDEWLSGVPKYLHGVMGRLHAQFRNADTLGSLIDPRAANNEGEMLFGPDMAVDATWDELRPHLEAQVAQETVQQAVLGHAAQDVLRAAKSLAARYTLVATNPPFLKRSSMELTLRQHIDTHHFKAKGDIATAFVERCLTLVGTDGSIALVSPQNWLLLTSYTALRQHLLAERRFDSVARLGSGAFRQITGEVVKVALLLLSGQPPRAGHSIAGLLAQHVAGPGAKAAHVLSGKLLAPTQARQQQNPDARITLTAIDPGALLAEPADGLQGIATGDYPRFGRFFWERPLPHPGWEFQQSTVGETVPHGGREHILWWESGTGILSRSERARIQGLASLGKRGVAVSQMGDLPATLYTGELFDNNTAVILPKDESDLPAIWAYCSSQEFAEDVREIDDALKVTNATLVKVAFDRDRWQRVADERGALPEPHSDDPTQWLFQGEITRSSNPLHVGLARLLRYCWPAQNRDGLDRFTETDGIVTLPNLGEGDGASRLRDLLSKAYGGDWSGSLERALVMEAGDDADGVEDWLRDAAFAQHCKIFRNRPFLWHIWDGRRDGFSALVNYHRFDRATLEKLTYSTLGAWIRRQAHEVEAGRAGADTRLAAAQALQRKLQLIIEGEPPYDIYVRWKGLHEQPLGWTPDLDDGVRLNIRPFVKAGVLRTRLNLKWEVPRYHERDLHFTLEEKRAARRAHGVSDA